MVRVKRRNNSRVKHLEHSELISTDDRFSQAEKSRLLDVYNQHGFQAFQDLQLLRQFFPNRTESNLKGLLSRLRTRLQQESTSVVNKDDNLIGWQKLCSSLMGSLARDKKVTLDNCLADALMLAAEERELNGHESAPGGANYPELLRSFAQLLMGRFPDNMTPENARISIKLYNHVNQLVESLNLRELSSSLEQGSWLAKATDEKRKRQEMALKGLDELDKMSQVCPSLRDLQKSDNIEALCLELPKIKRISEILNPLYVTINPTDH